MKSPTLDLAQSNSSVMLIQACLEVLRGQSQTTAVKQVSQYSELNEFFGFPGHIKVIFTLYYSLLSVQ